MNLKNKSSLNVTKLFGGTIASVTLSTTALATHVQFIAWFEDNSYARPVAGNPDSINLSEAQVATAPLLDSSPRWETTGDFRVVVFENGYTTLPGNSEARLLEPETIEEGFIYQTYLDFALHEPDDATANANPNHAIVNCGFYAGGNTDERLKIGLSRTDTNTYALHLQTDETISSAPPITSGAIVSSPIPKSSLGLFQIPRDRNDPDIPNHRVLRLLVQLTRGVDDSDWTITGRLFDRSDSTTPIEEVGSISASGVTFNTADALTAGFGGGADPIDGFPVQPVTGISSRAIDSFNFERFRAFVPAEPILTPPADNPAESAADLNNNGIPDIGEILHPQIVQFPIGEDSDNDGISNRDELRAQTDPFDPTSLFREIRITNEPGLSDNIRLTFNSVPQVGYRVDFTEDLGSGVWTALTPQITASGEETSQAYSRSTLGTDGSRGFFRVTPLPSPDQDSDGLEDSLELLIGSDPSSANSVRSAANGGDYQQFYNFLTGSSATGNLFNDPDTTTSSVGGIPSEEEASRFLAQATFGPTRTTINELRGMGPDPFNTWIDEQMELSPSLTHPYLAFLFNRKQTDVASGFPPINRLPHPINSNTSRFFVVMGNLSTIWMRNALFAPDQLRQRVAWALNQRFVTGEHLAGTTRPRSTAYDILIENAFGNYRDILFEMTLNPNMGGFLSSVNNPPADPANNQFPDENYAREVMQLFSIGLFELNMDGTLRLDASGQPIPTYDNQDITQLARVFTGLQIPFFLPNGRNPLSTADAASIGQMFINETIHDDGSGILASFYGNGGAKVFLGQSLPAFADDPGRTGMDDINDTIDILFNHPNCPPFTSQFLIQHLVTSNPSPAYVQRIAEVFADDGTGVRGNLAAVVKAILLDPEARSLPRRSEPDHGRLKAPMLRLTSLARATGVGEDMPYREDLSGIQFWILTSRGRPHVIANEFRQFPFLQPSVFSFYEPGYAHPGEIEENDLLSPEFQILNSITAVGLPNRFWTVLTDELHITRQRFTPDTRPSFRDFLPIAGDIPRLLDEVNLIFCHGTMSADTRSDITTALESIPNNGDRDRSRVQVAIFLATTHPDSAFLR